MLRRSPVENILRSFTRRIQGLENLNYWERLKELNLYSLERRRERYCIIYIWKILNNLAPNFSDPLEIELTLGSDRRGLKCKIPGIVSGAARSWKTIRENTLRIKGSKLFNKLPADLRELGIGEGLDEPKRVIKFKGMLDKFLQTIPDQPYLIVYHARKEVNLIRKVKGMRLLLKQSATNLKTSRFVSIRMKVRLMIWP